MPAAVFAVLMAILAARLILGALNLRGGFSGDGTLAGRMFAAVGLLAIGWVFGFLWFGQVQVIFNSDSRDVVVRKRGYLRWFETRYSLHDAQRLEVNEVRCGICSKRWILNTRFADGRSEEMVLLPEADKVADLIGGVTSLPVLRMPGA